MTTMTARIRLEAENLRRELQLGATPTHREVR